MSNIISIVASIPESERSLGGGMATHSVFLPGKSHGQRSLVDYSPWGCKSVGHDLTTKQNIYIYVCVCVC